jgi:hypothetical protein
MAQLAMAQGSAGSDSKIEPRFLIDLPTAGMLPHGNLALDVDFYESNGLLARVSIGPFDRLLFGVSYGGTNIVGSDHPVWNNVPGFAVKVRLLDESVFIPAIAFGFDSQGKGPYIDQLSRYTIKSLGLYAVGSKNYQAMGYLSFHGGINYSLERADGDKDPNVFFGIDKTLGPIISIVGEYNLGVNDSDRGSLGKGRGYLNAGVRASMGSGVTLSFNLKDIFQNQQQVTIGNRTVNLEFVRSL